ncbi:hypothetical protein UFOVP1229_110 [uncultured Caudovirales phage]|uniref:Uncharacterized protein n=1 Tax=uncultured Caudovirales phage TaxID=2100421 RepID=A0A6J5R494_9CAUD|nr:hypothetical protein UFOVP1229_110 [uncultured Caudovirales phage]
MMSQTPRKVFVHLQVADPNGAVKSDLMNYHVACDPTSSIPESWTPVISAVTCPLCMETAEYAEISADQSHASTADRKAHEHAAKIAKADAVTSPPNTNETTPPAE